MKTKLTLSLVSCLLLAGISFAQVYVPMSGPSVTSIQFKNNGVNYGAAMSGGGSINLATGCTASGASPNFTITCAPMVYPGAGIPVSTGSAWDSSISPSGAKCYPFQGSGGTGCDSPAGGLTTVTTPEDVLHTTITSGTAAITKQNVSNGYVLAAPPAATLQSPYTAQPFFTCDPTLSSTNTFTCNIPQATQAGNSLLIGGDTGSLNISSVTDNATGGSDTFTIRSSTGADWIATADRIHAGATTFTVTTTTSGSPVVIVGGVEIASTAGFDASGRGVGCYGAVNMASVTTTSVNDLVIGLCITQQNYGSSSWTITSPWLVVGSTFTDNIGGNYVAAAMVDQLTPATGAYQPLILNHYCPVNLQGAGCKV